MFLTTSNTASESDLTSVSCPRVRIAHCLLTRKPQEERGKEKKKCRKEKGSEAKQEHSN